LRAIAAAMLVVCAASAVVRADGVLTKPPRLVHFVEARRPSGKETVAATVTLSIDIDATGAVTNVTVVSSGGADFDAAAIAAAKQFTFTPAEVDGAPSPVTITYRYEFTVVEEPVAPAPQVNFAGVVKDRFTKKPIAGVAVTIVDLSISATTDDQGAFAFTDVPAGAHTIQLAAPSLVTVTTDETIAAGVKRTVTYLVAPRDDEGDDGADDEEVVRASRLKKESVTTTIRAEEARRVPGTQGDTLKVVQNLPGVARASFGSGQIVVWGAAPDETRVDLDGVELPALYHLGGLRATINAELVKSIELVPGAYGADHGRALGGLVRVQTRAFQPGGLHGYAALDPLDASAMLSETALGDRLRIGVAARYGIIDRVLSGLVASDVQDFVPIPRYGDAQLLATAALRSGEQLGVMILGSFDRLRRSTLSPDPTERASDATDDRFWRASLRYTRLDSDGASTVVVPWIGADAHTQTTSFGGAPTSLAETAWRYGLRASYRRRVAARATLTLGLDALYTHANVDRAGSLSLPAREGDLYVFGQPPGDDVNADRWTTDLVDVAPYAFAEVALGQFTITPGLRAPAYGIAASRATPRIGATPVIGVETIGHVLEPRLAATWRLSSRVALNAAGGMYHQAPAPEDLSAVFGTPTLGLERAWHATTGVAVKLGRALTVEASVYRKQSDALITRSQDPAPMLAHALVQTGSGTSTGAQLFVKQEMTRSLLFWLSYTYSHTERRDSPDAATRLFDFDQPHVLAAVVSWSWRGWDLGARARVASGAPRTPVIGATWDARDDRWDPIFGAHNSIRLPAFAQLDARVSRRFVRRDGAIEVYLEVLNVTDRKNAEELVYSHDWSRRGAISGLPTLAIVGVRIER
jgi:TonB family protein